MNLRLLTGPLIRCLRVYGLGSLDLHSMDLVRTIVEKSWKKACLVIFIMESVEDLKGLVKASLLHFVYYFEISRFLLAGEFFSPDDTTLINAYIENPANPGFSEVFQAIFNYLGLMPIVIACLSVPQASKRGLPPLPFLLSSFAMGYGGKIVIPYAKEFSRDTCQSAIID